MTYQETKADRLAILVASIAHAQAALTQAEACIRRIDHYGADTFESDTPRIVAGNVVGMVEALEHLKRNVAQVMHAHTIVNGVQADELPEPEPFDLAGGFLDDVENEGDTEGRA